MITKFKTKGIRLCESSVLGEVHKRILKDFDNKTIDNILNNKVDKEIGEDDTLGYTLELYYDEESNIGFTILKFKVFHKDYSTDTIGEKIISLSKESFILTQKEYKDFEK